MAALPVSVPAVTARRRPIALTQRRLEANRRNAARSTGPRTPSGKAKVARNAIKHGFFVAEERWSPRQHRDFEEILEGLRDELKPQGIMEEGCVATIAQSYVRMAAMLRYENIAALKYHQQCDGELNERIATANPVEAAQLRTERERLRRAGLWRPTIPGPREARAIMRYSGWLDRTIRRASSDLEELKSIRNGGACSRAKVQKQTHFPASPRSGREAPEGPRWARPTDLKSQKQTHFEASPRSGPEAADEPRIASSSLSENAKTNPLSSMFTGNRHERRRAKALAARRR
jgi:hypothetical protein